MSFIDSRFVVDTDGKNLQDKTGNLSALQTTNKGSLVDAVNETVSSLADKATQKDLDTANTKISDLVTVYASQFKTGAIDWGTAINNAINSITSGIILLPSGNLTITTPIILKSNITIKGQGSITVLKPQGCHAISCTLNSYLNTFSLQDFSIVGDNNGDMTTYDSNKHGINLNSGTSNDTFKGAIKNITITNCYGKGIYMPNAFNVEIDRVFVTLCGGNAIEVSGGPSFQISNCYVHAVANGKCAYRVYGSAVLTSCNGVDSGEVWGVFGCDGTANYVDTTVSVRQYNIMLINCNIEAVTKKGCIFLYQGRFAIHNTFFLVYSGLSTFEYYIDANNPSGCFIDTATTFQTQSTSIHPSPFRFANAYNFITFNSAITNMVPADGTTLTTIPGVSYEYTYAKWWMAFNQVNIKNMDYYYLGGKKNSYGTAAPTTGTWAVGDKVHNTAPVAGGKIGWVCVTAGTPGTWKAFGVIDA